MVIDNKSIIYVSGHNSETDIGITKKIEGFCLAAERNGFKTAIINRYCRTIEERKIILNEALQTNARYIIIRSFGSLNISCLQEFLKAKKEKRLLILDQPTPMCGQIHEIMMSKSSSLRKFYHVAKLYKNGPWGQWVFDKIIQYSEESWYFSLFNKRRTILMGNGIDSNRVPLRIRKNRDENVIRLIGIAANINSWHGFDRIIYAMGEWKKKCNKPLIHFHIIGNLISEKLPDLAKSCDVEEDVSFYGSRDSEFINNLYNNVDIAIGSLGLFRIGLNTSSILKVREYCMAGIPFIATGYDPDFEENLPFRFVVPNDNSIEPILQIFKDFPLKRKFINDECIRDYAINHLTFEAKFHQLMKELK